MVIDVRNKKRSVPQLLEHSRRQRLVILVMTNHPAAAEGHKLTGVTALQTSPLRIEGPFLGRKWVLGLG